jgi:hypothetical protein
MALKIWRELMKPKHPEKQMPENLIKIKKAQ